MPIAMNIKKWINDNEGTLVGWACLVCFVVIPMVLFFWYASSEKGTRWRAKLKAEMRVEAREIRRTCPEAGRRITTKDGLKGIVTRECWMGWNRYEVRLNDGTITYVNGKDFR